MVTLFLAGDVMTGRGIDQILPHPGEPEIFERYVASALDYVDFAEGAHGEIGKPAGFSYIWGDALQELERRRPDARIVNLETAVTASRSREPKGINYKMNPANAPVLTAAGIDVCVLSNNHMLDWGQAGLLDTLATLQAAGIGTVGAGGDLAEASQPGVVEASPGSRILVFGLGVASSGIPAHWAAHENSPGVRLLEDLSKETAKRLAAEVLAQKRRGDIAVISVHWGSNWGYGIPAEHRAFAHALIDLGACDILHGHSSHHARAFEVYRDKLILYGCGDFINDYEGIRGYESFRGDLSVMYLPSVREVDGALEALRLVIFQMRRFRLQRASFDDVRWLQAAMNRECKQFGAQLLLDKDDQLTARWS